MSVDSLKTEMGDQRFLPGETIKPIKVEYPALSYMPSALITNQFSILTRNRGVTVAASDITSTSTTVGVNHFSIQRFVLALALHF